jgi:hypothetical protein
VPRVKLDLRRKNMTNDSFLALTCVSLIAMLYGSVLAFAGYRFFLVLLPIWGFFFGFGLGAQSIQAIFGTAFLSDVISWVVGFIVGLVFAALSYLFYFIAVGLVAGALGYALGVGIMGLIGIDFGLLSWLVGIALGVLFAIVTYMLNIQKWIIILATSLLGAGVIVGTFLFLFGKLPSAQLVANPVKVAMENSPFWLITFIIIAILGFLGQYQSTRNFEVQTYNRMGEIMSEPSSSTTTTADTMATPPPTTAE